MSLHDHFVLVGHVPVVEPDFMTWARWIEEADRQVALDKFAGEVSVSTVFLGLDHNFKQSGPPLVFETTIFGGEHDGYLTRASSWDEALEQHAAAVELVKQSTGAL